MRVRLDYATEGLWIEVPEEMLLGVVQEPPQRVEGDPARLAEEALRSPLGTAPLGELARGRRSACVVIPDVTRPMPNRLILPPLLGALEAAGMDRENILILVATGLHRPNGGPELEGMVGHEIASRYRIANHVATDSESHAYLGTISQGIPVRVDRRYLEADIKVLTGLVEPHFMAGYSGGRKLVCPGLCAAETIHAFHGPSFVEHPKSTNCILEGNPTHLASTEAARRAGADFTLNVVMDSKRRVIAVFAGEIEEAFLAAARQAHGATTVALDEPAAIVVASGGGYPLDANWYQTIKGLVAAAAAVRDGGTIIVAAALSEGIGSADFARLIDETTGPEAFLRQIHQPGFFRNEQWQFEKFAHVARHASVSLYTEGLPSDVQEALFVTPVTSVEEGIAQAVKRHGNDAGILVMPHGPYVLPLAE